MTEKHLTIEDICPFVIEHSVRWGEMDAFEHVNNTQYFRYFEDVRIAYFKQLDLSPNTQRPRLGPILASISCDFKAPITFPDQLKIGATVADMGTKSFKMRYAIYSKKLDAIAATGESIIVLFNHQSKTSCAIPDDIREQVLALEHLAP